MSEVQTVETGAPVTGAALDAQVAETVETVLGMSQADRDAFLARTALTVDQAQAGLRSDVSLAESLAAVRVRIILAETAQGTASYQAALTFHAARSAEWFGFSGQGDYVTRGLGYRAASMGTLLGTLADAAIVAGIEDGTPEWRVLVQDSPTRSALKAALKDGAKTKAGTPTAGTVKSAVKAVHAAAVANPTGKAAKRAAKGPDQAPTADQAREACRKALDVIRTQSEHLTREGKAGLIVNAEALIHWLRTGEEPAVSGDADRNNRSARTGSAQ